MKRRIAVPLVMWSLAATAACSGDHAAGPSTPTCSSALASQLVLAIGAYTSLDPASDGGCVTIAANASTLDSAEYLIVPQSAAGAFGQSSPFELRTASQAAAAMPAAQLVEPVSSPRAVAVQFDGMLRRVGRTRAARAGAAARAHPAIGPAAAAVNPQPVSPPAPGSLRKFAVCSALDCSHFTAVTARAENVGAHIAIYVDTLAPAGGLDSADFDTLKQVFDSRLYPLDTATFGGVSDLDTNSVVIVLMTGVVNKLSASANCATSGYIAGFFFPPDLDTTAPIDSSNHGEIFYSIVADPSATLSCAHSRAGVKSVLPSTFTHEFQHMINFAQHVLLRPGFQTEEGWLDEGLSKYAEEIAGRSYLQQGDTATFSNYAFDDVYDTYQYLSAPGASPLLIQYDQGTLAEVGASWLFVRYLVDQFGDSLPHKLDGTTLAGSVNVATQTGQSFVTSVTRWALATWVSDLPGFTAPPELAYTSWRFRTRTFASLNAQDPGQFPRPYPLVPTMSAGSAVNLSGTLRSGSGVYHRVLQGPGAGAVTLLFDRGPGTPLPAAVGPRLSVIRIR